MRRSEKDTAHSWKTGFLGMYALSVMEEGPVYGYQIASRVAEKTENAWRPGAGSIYPALNRLTQKGLARERRVGRRRMYAITQAGRQRLRQFRKHVGLRSMERMEISRLFLDMLSEEEASRMLVRRLNATLEMIAELSSTASAEEAAYLRDESLAEVRRFMSRMEKVVA